VYGHLIPRGDRRAVDRLDSVTRRNPDASDEPQPPILASESEQIQAEVSELAL